LTNVTGLRARITPPYIDVAVASLTWICGGLYLFLHHTHVRFFVLKLVLYFSVVGGLFVFVTVVVMVPLNRVLQRWVQSFGSTPRERSFLRWLIQVAAYGVQVLIILWLAQRFVLFGM
jgi:hypothetical protein